VYETLFRVLESGILVFMGVLATLIFGRKKTTAETEKYQTEVLKLKQETERLEIENRNLIQVQMNDLTKQNSDLMEARLKLREELDRIHKGQADLEAALYITNQEKLNLSKELVQLRAENYEQRTKLEKALEVQHKDIVEIKKQTGQLPDQLPGVMEHKEKL
jgi:hypothetical protein